MTGLLEDPTPDWLRDQVGALLRFGAGARREVGFGWLRDDGTDDLAVPGQLWVNARMTHVFALGHLLGQEGAETLCDHGLAALTGAFLDARHGGWVSDLGDPAGPKQCYQHAFVVLAAASATIAGRPGAAELLDEVLAVVLDRFWDESAGAAREEWTADWSALSAYRGANANMHLVEALLAAADATGDGTWRQRARSISQRVVLDVAPAHGWRVVEHFTDDWSPVLDYNQDFPRDPFRPYGVTPGHGLEWARLLLQVGTSTGEDLREPAAALFGRAMADGWLDQGGLAYTTDFEGVPVVPDRFHWPVAEGIGAAATLHEVGVDALADYRRLWDFARERLVDPAGGWHHELGADGAPAAVTWSGKPDVYHAVQACLVPLLPVGTGFAAGLTRGGAGRSRGS